MKAVALIFALTVVTGCNARAVRQADATVTRFEDTVDRFWQYVSDLSQQADGVVETIKTSQLSRELDTLIGDTMAELTIYKDEIQAKLGPYTEIPTTQLTTDMQLLANKLQRDMLEAKERSTEYVGELKSMVQQNTDDVRARISAYTHKLKKRLTKDTDAIRNTASTYLGELQSRTSQNMEVVRGHVDTVRGHVEPYVQQASDSASKKLGDISTVLMSQAEGLGQQLETQAEGLRTQLEATAQELRTSLEGKIEDLTDLLVPYTTQIREKFEGILEKVKESAAAAAA